MLKSHYEIYHIFRVFSGADDYLVAQVPLQHIAAAYLELTKEILLFRLVEF